MKRLWLLPLLCLSFFSQAQNGVNQKIDSLTRRLPQMKADTSKVVVLAQIADNYQYIDPKKGLNYGEKSLSLARQLKWNDGIAFSYKSIGVNYFVMSDFTKALEYYTKGLAIRPARNIESHILNDLGVMYTYQSNYAKGLEYSFRSLKIRESTHDLKGIAVSSLNIGLVYYKMGNNKVAVQYYEKALRFSEKINNDVGLSRILFNLGNIYDETGQGIKAIAAYQRGMQICEKLGDLATKAKYLNALANHYIDTEEFALALQYCNASLALSEKTNDGSNIARCHGILGQIYYEMAQQSPRVKELLLKAKVHFEISLSGYRKLHMLDVIAYNYEMLSAIAARTGDHKLALELFKKSVVYKDSIFNSENKETIKNLEDQRTIELRDKEIKINRLKLENKERQNWYSIFGLCLFGIIGALLFYQSNSRRKTNRKLSSMNTNLDQANKIKTRLLGILNHDLRGPVNSFIHFIQLQKESPELLTETTKKRIEDTTIASAKNLLVSMEDILLWTKNQMDNFEPQPKDINVASLFNYMRNHFSAVENVDFTFEEIQDDLHITTDEDYLKTILRNLTANAIAAVSDLPEPKIIWKAWSSNGSVLLSISDNGAGGNQEHFHALYNPTEVGNIRSGLGLHLVRDLAQAIGCLIEVKSVPGDGTTFTLSFA